jgi:hypothetical protein
MNMKTVIFLGLALGLLAGCASETTSDFIPVEGNFGYVTHVKGTVDQSVSAGFCYRDTNGNTTVVWPSLKLVQGNNMIVNNDEVVLVGGKAVVYNDDKERRTRRWIAFKGPDGPPMDITDQILMRFYAGTGMGLTNFMWDTIGSLVKTNGAIQVEFCSSKGMPGDINFYSSAFGCHLTISWHDIEAIMVDVKKNGKLKKENWSGVEYLQKEYQPDEPK